MRRGVFDDHVMIGELFPPREVKSVENALQAFAHEFGADVVARKSRSDRKRMDVRIAPAAQLGVQRADMKRALALILKRQVLNGRAIAGDQLRDGVGEVRRVS